MMRKFIVLFALFALLAVAAAPAAAQTSPLYLQITNGVSVSPTAGELVQVNIQFGNRGAATVYDVAVQCFVGDDEAYDGTAVSGDGQLRLTGAFQTHGSFGSAGVSIQTGVIEFPRFLSNNPPLFNFHDSNRNLIPGQSRNVSFTVRANDAGKVDCRVIGDSKPNRLTTSDFAYQVSTTLFVNTRNL